MLTRVVMDPRADVELIDELVAGEAPGRAAPSDTTRWRSCADLQPQTPVNLAATAQLRVHHPCAADVEKKHISALTVEGCRGVLAGTDEAGLVRDQAAVDAIAQVELGRDAPAHSARSPANQHERRRRRQGGEQGPADDVACCGRPTAHVQQRSTKRRSDHDFVGRRRVRVRERDGGNLSPGAPSSP
jgi:hypothetical protein